MRRDSGFDNKGVVFDIAPANKIVMADYFKYLPVSSEDEQWGLCILNAGRTHVRASGTYPSPSHPKEYYYNWPASRILDEYQIIYILRGSGIFESQSCQQQKIASGTIIFLFPREQHRFRPDSHTGWDEYWIGCKGNIIDNLISHHFFSKDNPIITIGTDEKLTQLFNEIIEETQQESAGYQQVISGIALQLLGRCLQRSKEPGNITDKSALVITQAKLLLRENLESSFSPEEVAGLLHVGYSWFRKEFKKHTGMSPGQYQMQLKLEKAKYLLKNMNTSSKEISISLGFHSSQHFSTLFKEKTGYTPSEYRALTMPSNLSEPL